MNGNDRPRTDTLPWRAGERVPDQGAMQVYMRT